jgi:hypothetical protein
LLSLSYPAQVALRTQRRYTNENRKLKNTGKINGKTKRHQISPLRPINLLNIGGFHVFQSDWDIQISEQKETKHPKSAQHRPWLGTGVTGLCG